MVHLLSMKKNDTGRKWSSYQSGFICYNKIKQSETIPIFFFQTQMPDPKTFKQHFESKHPKSAMPPELVDVQAWRVAE